MWIITLISRCVGKRQKHKLDSSFVSYKNAFTVAPSKANLEDNLVSVIESFGVLAKTTLNLSTGLKATVRELEKNYESYVANF